MDEISLIEENRQLKEAARKLLEEIGLFNNGCYCCADTTASETEEYKTLKSLINT